MKAAVASVPLRDWLLKKPAWLDHETVVGLDFAVKTFAASLLALYIASILVFDGRLLLRLWVGERFLTSYPLLLILTAGYLAAFAQQSCVIAIARSCRASATAASIDALLSHLRAYLTA